MPNQAHINEIAAYLRDFKEGKRLHNQEYFHSFTSCGTAHCLAGWKQYDDAVKAQISIDWNPQVEPNDPHASSDDLVRFSSKVYGVISPWAYAVRAWDLDDNFHEDERLFRGSLTLDEMIANLEDIAQENHLTVPDYL
jgi:hypothetical protein